MVEKIYMVNARLNLFICGYRQRPCVDVQQGVDSCDFTISAPSRGVVSASPSSSAEDGSRSDIGSPCVVVQQGVDNSDFPISAPSRDYMVERVGGIEGDGVGRKGERGGSGDPAGVLLKSHLPDFLHHGLSSKIEF